MTKPSNSIIDAVKLDPFDPGANKETIVKPDTVSSGETAKSVGSTVSGVAQGYGQRPKSNLPMARLDLYEDIRNAEKRLEESRSKRDEHIESVRQDKKSTKRSMREKSIVPDDFDLDDEFDSTDPVIASLFKKGKINKLLKDQIKEQYPDQIAEISERIKNDPDNADLSGKEVHKLINAEVNKFIEPLWRDAGGDTQVNKIRLIKPVAVAIKKMIDGSAPESVTKMLNDKRAALEKKQNRSLKDQMFLDAFNMVEKDLDSAEVTTELKGNVKSARDSLTNLNAELREHEKAVDRAIRESSKGGRKSRTEYTNGWYFTHTSGDGRATQYASRVEKRDGKRMLVTYSVTAGSPNTNRDPVRISEYKEYQGARDPNIMDVENFAESRLDQVEGGFKNQTAAIRKAQSEKDFEALDGQNYFAYRKAHAFMAPKIVKLISDLGGKIDAETGKIYTTSVADFPEGANELHLDYKTAKRIAGKSDEDVARLTGMTPEEVKARQTIGMMQGYKLGDANVTVDEQGRTVYHYQADNKTTYSGKDGRSFYINWNNPYNKKVVAEYAKLGKSIEDIPISELKTVNTSRSTAGNIDWSDKAKTRAAERAQLDRYTGAYKPSADILDALIGFGRK